MKAFHKQLKQALKNYHKPEWLGQQSPLATPYFLSSTALKPSMATVVERGQMLCQELHRAGRTLWGASPPRSRDEIEQVMSDILQMPGSQRYNYLVLELRYFNRFFKPRRLSDIWNLFLGESRAEFYRDLDKAIEQLGITLLRQLHPTFRLERPVAPPILIGRDDVLAQCLEALQARKTVTLSGAGGIGKTALGATIASKWPSSAVFWFTIRPTLNDRLSSLLFSLAYFFHRQGTLHLWQYLIANQGKIEDFNVALGLVREDLDNLQQPLPLLCFDEMDRLHAADVDRKAQAYAQILEFLDSLQSLVPMLLIGQRAILDTDSHYALQGLTAPYVHVLAKQVGISFVAQDIEQLCQYTSGNPRLIQLCMDSRQNGETLATILANLPKSPALQPLFDRLWLRTTANEQRLLQSLSVFRGYVPLDAWSADRDTLNQLRERHLLQQDSQGSIALLPAWRALIYAELSPEWREQCHLQAAAIRMTRAEYTAAAYHYYQAGSYKEAVQVWFPHRQQEIERGQAEAALAIFQQISLRRLGRKERKALSLLRAELKKLIGDLQGGLADLETHNWHSDSEIALQARLLQGTFLVELGYPDKAIDVYSEGITIIGRLQAQLMQFHNNRSRAHLRQKRINEAWREATLARYEMESLHALVQSEQGRFADAYLAHQQALALAKSLNYDAGLAQTHRYLAVLSSRQARLDEAITHTEKAIAYFQQVGDQLNMAMTQINLAATYVQVHQFDKAIEIALAVLPFFERINHPHSIAVTAANLAEAYFELGDLAKAQKYAQHVLYQEDPHAHPYGLYTLGRIWQAKGELDKAQVALSRAHDVAQKHEDAYMLAYAKRLWGQIMIENNNPEEGQHLLKQALHLFESLDIAQEVAETKRLVANQIPGANGDAPS